MAIATGLPTEQFCRDKVPCAHVSAELDAYYAKVYSLTRDELRYIFDPQDVYGPDFPGETFRALKDKEMRLYGEYRARRLVLEAWDRLEGIEIGNPDGYQEQAAVVMPTQKTIPVPQPKPESRPAAAQSLRPTPPKPTSPVKNEVEEPAAQPTLTDFGLYKCEACGKLVMGYEKESHEREKHNGKSVEWKKITHQ